jgi:hypothetical protein
VERCQAITNPIIFFGEGDNAVNAHELNKQAVKEKIQRWLSEEGYVIEMSNDPNSYFNGAIKVSGKYFVNVIITNDSPDLIMIGTAAVFDQQDMRLFAYLKPDLKRNFINDLESMMLQIGVSYQFEPARDNVQRVMMQVPIYFDGLTKHSLMIGILQLTRTLQACMLRFSQLSKSANQ